MRFPLAAIILVTFFPTLTCHGQLADTLGFGWSRTSVNTVVFRKNAVSSGGGFRYAAWYDSLGFVSLAKHEAKKWITTKTDWKGKVADADNSISIIADGDGVLHMAWDHHNTPLKYARDAMPGAINLKEETMIGTDEERVTYPEFHRLSNGDLIFLYRNGQSGSGNLVMNHYDLKSKKWSRVHSNLIDGEGQRNAYWQAYADQQGTIHLSWVWRESPDVASNHDMCYARSKDGGKTWERTDGTRYTLPINATNAEYAMKIPQKSELINQTSMTATRDGRPIIASYWRAPGAAVPQYFVIYHDDKTWNHQQVTNRTLDFTLSGGGTKRIPISRPQVTATNKRNPTVAVVYRDAERGNTISLATTNKLFAGSASWKTTDIIMENVGQWEPTFDTDGSRKSKELFLFVQRTGQGDGEKTEELNPQPVVVLRVSLP